MKGFDLALWPNKYKTPGSRQPDARGAVSIPVSVLKDLSIAYQKGELSTETDTRNGDIEIVKLDASAWRNEPEGNKPVIKCEIQSWEEMKQRQAEREAKAAGAAAGGSGGDDAATGWSIPF